MNFFRAQQQARTNSRHLLLLFTLAVMAITIAITLIFYLVFGHHEAEQALFSSAALGQNFGLIGFAAIGTVLFISGASFFRAASLRNGGGQVARDLGGDRVTEDVSDPMLQRLRNVVEEIAIASGVPVPEIYVLEHESGINAFAAGHGLSDAAIAVTRGTLEHLSRDELQGVIAHEFSHILNGDMRLNLRLLGLLFGITAIALVGRKVLYHFRYVGGGDRRGIGGVMIVAMALLAIGSIGLFFARWIKAAISRQRETLADASAVQFTRNPQGIAGALKKIAASGPGSLLTADSEEVDHMLFSNGRLERLFATHPPILQRIQAIEPGFQKSELPRIAATMRSPQKLETARQQAAFERPGRSVTDARAVLDGIGQPHWQQILYAAVLAQAMPDNLVHAARSPQRAPALTLYLLLSNQQETREKQLLTLAQRNGDTLENEVRTLFNLWGACQPEQRLPLLEMALPALKRRPRRELLELLQTIEAIAPHDHLEAIFPFLLSRIIHLYLEESLAAPAQHQRGKLRIERCLQEAATVLALLAHYEDSPRPAEQAYMVGFSKLTTLDAPTYAPPDVWSTSLDAALKQLDQLRPSDKEQFIEALLTVAFNDREVNINELELVRAICATLHVPLPPIQASRISA